MNTGKSICNGADVGVTMGRAGTQVAKGAADYFLIVCNLSEIVIMLGAQLLGRTMVFLVAAFTSILHIFTVRSRSSMFKRKIRDNMPLVYSVTASYPRGLLRFVSRFSEIPTALFI